MNKSLTHTDTEAAELLAFAIDAAELATWDLNPLTNRLTCNSRLKEWFGLDAHADIELWQAVEAIAEKDRPRVTEAIQRALDFSSGGGYEIEYTITNLITGQERIVRAKGKAVFDTAQNPSRFNGIIMDITSEVSAMEQRQKLLTLVDNSVDLMSILEPNGVNSYINAAGREILGIDADADVTRIPITHFHTEEQIAFVEANILPSVMTTGRWSGQFAIRNGKTGEIIPLFNNCHRIIDDKTGLQIGVGAVMRDMRPELNARKELEEKVKERTKELQEANDELEKKNKELASFAYVSSHDLQEPLRKITTFISRIEKAGLGSDPENEQEYFKRIKLSAMRMQVLINDLLSFSHTNTDQKEFVQSDLGKLVDEVIADLNETIHKTNAVIRVGELPQASVILFQFHQLLTNLITNAIKFAKPGEPPAVIISGEFINGTELKETAANQHETYCHLTIEDNGIGFDPQYSERIFEVFQRLHGRNEYEGTGIGLAICKKIVENHQGLIKAEGVPGKGAAFHVYLPIKKG